MSIIASLLSIIFHPFTNLTWTSQGMSGNTPKLFSWYQWRGFFFKTCNILSTFSPQGSFCRKSKFSRADINLQSLWYEPKKALQQKSQKTLIKYSNLWSLLSYIDSLTSLLKLRLSRKYAKWWPSPNTFANSLAKFAHVFAQSLLPCTCLTVY